VRGEAVLDAGWNLGIDRAFDQAIALQLVELPGEHALAHAGDRPTKLREAKSLDLAEADEDVGFVAAEPSSIMLQPSAENHIGAGAAR
jgi:hypothetical protein